MSKIERYDAELLEAEQDERELRSMYEYAARTAVPTDPLTA